MTSTTQTQARPSRSVPEDLRKLPFAKQYVFAVFDEKQRAERAAKELLEAGFAREELVLISQEVDSLDATARRRDSLEVGDPDEIVRSVSRFSGAVTGLYAGALLGLVAAFVGEWGTVSQPVTAVVGAVVGAFLGAGGGLLWHRLFHRQPDRGLRRELAPHEVLVGVGLRSEEDHEKRSRAEEVLQRFGLRPIVQSG